MLVTVDVSDLHLGSNHLFRLLEPYLLDCALNYCASYRYMEYEKFHTEMIEYLFDGTLWDEDFNDDRVVMDRINDLEEHEFNSLVMLSYSVYLRVIQYFSHIWKIQPLKESVLVMYQGQLKDYRLIQVEIELDAPDHLISAVHNQQQLRRKRKTQNLTYIPQGI